MLHQFHRTLHCRGDDRFTAGHGFQYDVEKSFPQGRQHKDVEGMQQGFDVAAAPEKRNGVSDA